MEIYEPFNIPIVSVKRRSAEMIKYAWIAVIAIIKTGNIVWGLIRDKRLISIHSILNKIFYNDVEFITVR